MGEPDEVATRGDGPLQGMDGAGGLHGTSEQSERPARRQREVILDGPQAVLVSNNPV